MRWCLAIGLLLLCSWAESLPTQQLPFAHTDAPGSSVATLPPAHTNNTTPPLLASLLSSFLSAHEPTQGGPVRPVALQRSFEGVYNQLKQQLRVMNQGDVASFVMLLTYLMSKWNDVPTEDVLIPMTMYKLLSSSNIDGNSLMPMFRHLTGNRPPNPPPL